MKFARIDNVKRRNPMTRQFQALAVVEGETVDLRSYALPGDDMLVGGERWVLEGPTISPGRVFARAVRRPPRASYAVEFAESDCFAGTPRAFRRVLAQAVDEDRGILERLRRDGVRALRGRCDEDLLTRAAGAARGAAGGLDCYEHLRDIGFSSGQAATILKACGTRASVIAATNPFRFCGLPGIDRLACDAVALEAGLPSGSPYRASQVLGDYVRNERVVFREAHAEGDLETHVGLDIAGGIDRLLARGSLVAIQGTEDTYATHGVAALAQDLAERIERLSCAAVLRVPAEVATHDDQGRALAALINAPVGILTGGPGTGKTHILRELADRLDAVGPVMLAAPTGKAAQRMAEATGREAATVHRLLQYRDGKFARNAKNKLPCASVLLDEASMLDEELCHALVTALPVGARLLLSGDPEQLPPVGRGETLHALMATGAVPVANLTTVRRQGKGSMIARGAAQIRARQEPEVSTKGDWQLRPSGGDALQAVLQEVTRDAPRAAGCAPFDVMVLAARHEGDVGVKSLNAHLQDALNPAAEGKREIAVSPEMTLREGDRVRQTRNNYRLEVMNGECGRIEKINVAERSLAVRFDDRRIDFSLDDAGGLTLGYCSTVHAAQGSEYPAVVLPLSEELTRPLIYTALTRAQRYCAFVGDRETLDAGLAQGEARSASALYQELREIRSGREGARHRSAGSPSP